MKDIAVGCDIVEVDRVANLIDRFGNVFLKKIFSESEIAYCQKKSHSAASFAVRFAAKEAFSKAIGCGIGQHLGWKDIAVEFSGYPRMILTEKAHSLMRKFGFSDTKITLSHTKTLAQAVVVLIR